MGRSFVVSHIMTSIYRLDRSVILNSTTFSFCSSITRYPFFLYAASARQVLLFTSGDETGLSPPEVTWPQQYSCTRPTGMDTRIEPFASFSTGNYLDNRPSYNPMG